MFYIKEQGWMCVYKPKDDGPFLTFSHRVIFPIPLASSSPLFPKLNYGIDWIVKSLRSVGFFNTLEDHLDLIFIFMEAKLLRIPLMTPMVVYCLGKWWNLYGRLLMFLKCLWMKSWMSLKIYRKFFYIQTY